jgi:hypothetical protein
MSYAKRVDENQKAIVADLRKGMPTASVAITSGAGDGFADLVVGWRGRTFLYEVKNPDKPASGRSLTTAQQKFHAAWKGHIKVVHSAVEIAADIAEQMAGEK